MKPIGSLFQNLQQIVLYVLEHKVDDSLLAEGLFHLYYIPVVEHLENFDFTNCCFFGELLIVGLLEFFDGDVDTLLEVTALENNTIGSFPNGRHDLILLHLLIINLELIICC